METPDLEKLLEGVHVHRDQMNPAGYRFTTCDDCPYKDPEHECFRLLMNDVVHFVEAQQPRVLTYNEARENAWKYHDPDSCRPVFVQFRSDMMTEDMYPPYRGGYNQRILLGQTDNGRTRYGKDFVFWSDRPTKEQRKAVAWNDCTDSCPIEGRDAD